MEAKVEIPENGNVCPRKQRRKTQKMLVMELLLDYAKNSTLHGLRYITEPGISAIEKTFWGITFTISVVLCFIFITQLYRKWNETPVIISLNEYIVPVRMIPFPSVTICPQEKIVSSRYNYSNEKDKYIGKTNFLDNKSIQKIDDVSLICGNEIFGARNLSTQGDAARHANSSTIDNILEVSPTLEEVFDWCVWRGDLISNCQGLFTKVLTQEGVCYNFNSLAAAEILKFNSIQQDYSYHNSHTFSKKWNVIDNYLNLDSDAYPWRGRAHVAEPDLKVVLMSPKNEHYTSCEWSEANKGFKIFLQHPADFPQISPYYYELKPNQVSSLGLKFSMMTTSTSLKGSSPNVRKCYFPDERPLRYFHTYTLSNCQLECQSNITFRKCDCVGFHMPHYDSVSICSSAYSKCVKHVLDFMAEQESKAEIPPCQCFPACNYVNYDAEILKTDTDEKIASKAVVDVMNVAKNIAVYNRTHLFDNMVSYSTIEMYFKEPRSITMRRSELFGRNEFLANCGGLLGLFLGFSFLSIIEIIYFTTLRLYCILKRDVKAE